MFLLRLNFFKGENPMRKCKFEDLIDDYLLNRLDEDKKKKFEEHYFNCPSCFEKMVERDELISIIKYKRDMIFQDEYAAEEAKGAAWFEKIVSLLTPKQWAAAAVSTCLLLLVSIGVIFYFNSKPSFRLDKPDVRGGQITIKLIPPVGVPSKIEWSRAGEDADYKISINHNRVQLGSWTTKENFIALPDEVKSRLALGEKYSCEVKAFSPPGSLVASGETSFKILKTE
jgi:hypothetical protein